jgi:glutamyl-tRNA synthetase
MSEVRTRFAPSPTGALHVGGAHTALFAWLFARHEGGKFILRVEDTDEVRSTPESLQAIYDGLKWIGMDWDEGPDIGGPYAPYIQSERLDIYQQHVDRLMESGRAYRCYCTPEELEERREIMRKRGLPPRYDGRCRGLSDDQRAAFEAEGRDFCVNFAMQEAGATVINDIVRGEVSFDNSLMGDFVIQKTSRYPTYHMAVVVDDNLMDISHVIRAEEHLSNTPRHVQLMDALGFAQPRFAHLPIILGTDRTKLSKRHGAVNLMDYADRGFLPEAMCNFLALLGWSPGSEDEIFTLDEIVERFTLEAVSKSPGIFDIEKATWLNGEYLKRAKAEQIARDVEPAVRSGLNVTARAERELAQYAHIRAGMDHLKRIEAEATKAGITAVQLAEMARAAQTVQGMDLRKIQQQAAQAAQTVQGMDLRKIQQQATQAARTAQDLDLKKIQKRVTQAARVAQDLDLRKIQQQTTRAVQAVQDLDLKKTQQQAAQAVQDLDLQKIQQQVAQAAKAVQDQDFKGVAAQLEEKAIALARAEHDAWLVKVVDLMKERTRLLNDFTKWGSYYFTDEFPYDNRARSKWLSREDVPDRLDALADRLEPLENWDVDGIEVVVRGLAEELEVSAAKVIHPCRSAVTGQTIGPSLFHLMELLPRETVVARLRKAAELGRAGEMKPDAEGPPEV